MREDGMSYWRSPAALRWVWIIVGGPLLASGGLGLVFERTRGVAQGVLAAVGLVCVTVFLTLEWASRRKT